MKTPGNLKEIMNETDYLQCKYEGEIIRRKQGKKTGK